MFEGPKAFVRRWTRRSTLVLAPALAAYSVWHAASFAFPRDEYHFADKNIATAAVAGAGRKAVYGTCKLAEYATFTVVPVSKVAPVIDTVASHLVPGGHLGPYLASVYDERKPIIQRVNPWGHHDKREKLEMLLYESLQDPNNSQAPPPPQMIARAKARLSNLNFETPIGSGSFRPGTHWYSLPQVAAPYAVASGWSQGELRDSIRYVLNGEQQKRYESSHDHMFSYPGERKYLQDKLNKVPKQANDWGDPWSLVYAGGAAYACRRVMRNHCRRRVTGEDDES